MNMAIQVEWFDENQDAVRFIVEKSWTWDEFYEAVAQSHRMMDNTPASRVALVMDMTNSRLLPQNVLSHVRNVSNKKHPRTGIGIVVGAGVFVLSLFRVIQRLTPERMKNMRMVKTLEEAKAILNSQRSTGSPG
jgi:hypothetical protein